MSSSKTNKSGQQYRLTRDVLWWTVFAGQDISLTLKEGEVCEYYRYSNNYHFEERFPLEQVNGAAFVVSPWYPASVVEAWGFWFEPVKEQVNE